MAKKRKILITGVAGFIGSNLASELLKRKYEVIGLDNLSQGNKRNIINILKDADFRFVKGDVRSENTVNKLMDRVSCIVHLAAFKIPRYGNAMDTLMVNSKGTEVILEAARKHKCKLVFASTSDVYGKHPVIPFKEDGDLLLGNSKVKRWSYAVSKLFDEHLCFAYEEKYGLEVCILRFFGSYGPNQNLTWWGGPQSVFIKAALDKKPMEIHGNGLQSRSFTYIDDTINGIIRAIEVKRSAGEIFNIGNNKEITILQLAKFIWRLVNGDLKPKLKFIPYTAFAGKNYQDVMRRIPDINKARDILGFSPKVDMRRGLLNTIEWQKGTTE